MTAPGTGTPQLARPGDEERIDAFLSDYAETSMFLRSNLASQGFEASDSRYGTELFVFEKAASVQGVIGLSNGGYLVAQLPYAVDLAPVARHWNGRDVIGLTGVPEQVSHVLVGLGLAASPTSLDEIEPLYALDLSALTGPFPDLRAPQPSDLEMLEQWFFDYVQDTGSIGREEVARADAKARAERAIAEGQVRIMEQDGRAVAMTSFNALVADMVQIDRKSVV